MKHLLSFFGFLLLVCILTVFLSACDLFDRGDSTVTTTGATATTTTCSGTTAPSGSNTSTVTTAITAPVTQPNNDNEVGAGDIFS